jgi:hypothetical protein
MDMKTPRDEDISREMAANPGLGRMQAINNLRGRRHVRETLARSRPLLSARFS